MGARGADDRNNNGRERKKMVRTKEPSRQTYIPIYLHTHIHQEAKAKQANQLLLLSNPKVCYARSIHTYGIHNTTNIPMASIIRPVRHTKEMAPVHHHHHHHHHHQACGTVRDNRQKKRHRHGDGTRSKNSTYGNGTRSKQANIW